MLPSAVATFVPSAVGKIFGNHCPSWGFSEGLIMNNYMFSNNHVWHSEHGPDPLYELQKGQFPRPGPAANVSTPVFWLPNCSDGREFETLGREGSGTFVGVWNTICQPLSVCGNLPAVMLYWWHAGPYFFLLKPRGDTIPLSISGNQGTGGSGKSDLMFQTGALSLDAGGKAEGTVRINLGQHVIIAAVSSVLDRLLQRTTAWVGPCPLLKPVPLPPVDSAAPAFPPVNPTEFRACCLQPKRWAAQGGPLWRRGLVFYKVNVVSLSCALSRACKAPG